MQDIAHARTTLARWARRLALLALGVAGLQGCGGGADTGGFCASYWVSPSGDDAGGDGSQAHPFASVDRARQAVRADARRAGCRIAVNIAGGTYALQAPLVFDAKDSGAPGREVVYRAAPGNTQPVLLSGGIPVNGFQCGGGRCVASVPQLPAGVLPRQFYVDDHRAIRARSNPTGSIEPDYAWVSTGFQAVGSAPSLSHPELVEAVTTTQWKMMRCPVGSLSGSTLVMAQPCWNNANTFPAPWSFYQLSWLENAPEFLTAPNMWYLDPYSKTLSYLMASQSPPANAWLPLLESLLRIEGQPGAPVSSLQFLDIGFAYATWLLPNSGNGYVSDQSGNLLIGSPYASNAIGHQQLTFPTPGNVSARYARNIAFIGDTFEHLGAAALSLGTGCQDNLVQANRFVDISGSAVVLGGISPQDARPDADSANRDNRIVDNVISQTGQDYWDTAAIYVGFTRGSSVSHNAIDNVPWSGIAIGWGWGLLDPGGFPGLPNATPGMWGSFSTPTAAGGNQIGYNLISDFLEKLWDGGAIYTNGAQGTSLADGLLIQGNVARNKRAAAGGNMFYTDGGSRFITLVDNVAVDDPVGTVDFGPCGYPTSFQGASFTQDLCLLSGLLPYGADMGGCLPAGDLDFSHNYLGSPSTFYDICHNVPYVPSSTPALSMSNIAIRSAADVPVSVLQAAGPE